MYDIYRYNNDFDRSHVMNNVNEIAEELETEREKPDNERNEQRELKLIYKQFVEGLKLSTRSVL